MELVLETAKSRALEAISDLPDTATYDDIFYKLYVTQKIESGRQDISNSEYYSHQEVRTELSRWLD